LCHRTVGRGQKFSQQEIRQCLNLQTDSPPGTGGVAEGRGGRSSTKLILCLTLSTSPARQARRPLLFQEGNRERLYFKPRHYQSFRSDTERPVAWFRHPLIPEFIQFR